MKPDNVKELSETLKLHEYTSPRSGNFGFWLYDKTRGMNLAMRAESETQAFVYALTYYQKRLATVEADLASLHLKVDNFISQFVTEETE